MQVPTKQPRFKISRIEKRLGGTKVVKPDNPIRFGQIASRTTEGKIVERCLSTQSAWSDMLDVECDPSRRLQEPAVLADTARSGNDQRPKRYHWGHGLPPRSRWLNPNRHGDSVGTLGGNAFAVEIGQSLRVDDH